MNALLKGLFTGLLLVPALAFAHGASRLQIDETVFINADPATVWAAIKDFDKIHEWHPAVASTLASGGNAPEATRTLTLENGATVENVLNRYDAEKMSFQYDIVSASPVGQVDIEGETFDVPVVPVSRYKGWVKVEPEAAGSKVTMTGKFFRAYTGNHYEPEEVNDATARTAVSGMYRAGLDNLKTMVEK